MRALISERTFSELLELRNRLVATDSTVGQVFVPVGAVEPAPVRILFVGQASYGELLDFEPASVEEAAGAYADQAKKNIDTGLTFWGCCRAICDQVLLSIGADAYLDRRECVIGWSNLAKIGLSEKRNPTGHILKEQSELCINSLEEEIRTMKPDATVLLTGHYGQEEILDIAFGLEGWHNNVRGRDRVATHLHPKFGLLLWAYHPLEMNFRGIYRDVVAFVAGSIAGTITGRKTTEGRYTILRTN